MNGEGVERGTRIELIEGGLAATSSAADMKPDDSRAMKQRREIDRLRAAERTQFFEIVEVGTVPGEAQRSEGCLLGRHVRRAAIQDISSISSDTCAGGWANVGQAASGSECRGARGASDQRCTSKKHIVSHLNYPQTIRIPQSDPAPYPASDRSGFRILNPKRRPERLPRINLGRRKRSLLARGARSADIIQQRPTIVGNVSAKARQKPTWSANWPKLSGGSGVQPPRRNGNHVPVALQSA